MIIAKKSLLGKADPDTPLICDWMAFEKAPDAQLNTPPCWSIYVMALNVKHMIENGGVAYYKRQAELKASMVYDLLDNSDGFYQVPVKKPYRSRINVVFTLSDARLEKLFIEEARKLKVINIKGHVSKGGFRCSIYSAMPMKGVKALCKHIVAFKERVSKDKSLFRQARL